MSKNKNRSKKPKTAKIEEVKDTIPSFLKSNYIISAILVAIMSLSFYIRGIIPAKATFANGVTGFAMDDSVYHMRLVENLIANFPHRLTFDAFTQYPSGSLLSWGSFYDLIIGTLAIIFGVNNLNTIGAYVPVIMGTLVVIPVYFIGKELFNKKAGLIGAFIVAILPGAFLQRSTLGFTDHHVAEALFTTFFLMFLVMAFNRVNSRRYAILSGIFLGLYLLTWTTGLIFAGIVAIFLVLQIFVNYMKNKSNSTLLTITTFVYGIPTLMVLPFVDLRNGFGIAYYSPTHIISLLAVILMCFILDIISKKAKELKLDIFKFVGISLALFIGLYIMIGIISPTFSLDTFGSLNIVFGAKSGGGLTIGEAQPTNFGTIQSMFGLNFIFAIISMILLIVYYIKEKKESVLIVLTWSILILLMFFAQNRFAYYFAINIAILSGFICGYILDYVGKWKDIKNINVWNISSFIIVIFIVGFYPLDSSPYVIATKTTEYGVLGEGFYEWHDALSWMRNNTPDPSLDYYGTYERPEVGTYNYPETAYGVMSWWDYGHIITYWGHRIPNANPFQSGIGGGTLHLPGASTFLIAPTEDEANKVLDAIGINGKPGAKYVVSNAYMAYAIQQIFAEWDGTNTDYFRQVRTSQGAQILPSEKLYNTMESKLHIFDTNGLKNYRLIHESTPNQYVRGGADELQYKNVYNVLINPSNPIPVEYSGYVKIFELVKGANIVGKTTPNSEVKITLNIITNINRNILYTQKTTSDSEGKYVLTVPYSTTGTLPGETQFDTKSIGAYELSTDGKTIDINISEYNILNGNTINIQE